jgi:hypothetical protein
MERIRKGFLIVFVALAFTFVLYGVISSNNDSGEIICIEWKEEPNMEFIKRVQKPGGELQVELQTELQQEVSRETCFFVEDKEAFFELLLEYDILLFEEQINVFLPALVLQ